MKNYHSLLLVKAAVCFLAIAQPSQAVNPSETDLAIASPLMTEDKVVDQTKISIERDLGVDLGENLTTKDGDLLKSDKPGVKIKGLDTPSLEAAPKIAQSYNPSGGMPVPPNGVMVPNPEIIIKSNGTPNPTIIQPTTPALPLLPRAVAPPVGDMSISNINASPAILDLGPAGNTIIPRLVLRQAPADEVLKVLARYAGVNLVSIDSTGGAEQANGAAPPVPAATGSSSGNANISLDIENEPVQNVFNSVLMASGLKASRRGNTIFVGKRLPDEARNTVTRTLRLNQAKAEQVATFLASQGAEVNVLFQEEETVVEVAKTTIDPDTGEIKTEPPKKTRKAPKLTSIKPETIEGSDSSFILKGLLASTDQRLNTVTLVGEARQVEVATSLITQMDARRRQVSINVKVVDIQLDDSQEFGVGWSTGNTDGFISTYNPLFPIESAGSAFLRFGQAAGQFYPQYFQAQIDAVIRNKNAKVLTDPTLVVQEGQLANVALVQSVLTGQTVSYENTGTGANAGTVAVITPTFEYVGLTLGINVEGIDDNGFISFVVKPTISAPSGTVNFNSGGIVSNTNTFTLITKREVSSGLIRVRDGQTLILSGIISETDKVDTQKVPILGDIPFLGVLFRKQLDSTQRSEVVVILTPRIINDEPSVNFGSNYTPTKEALELLRQNNFPVQVLP